VSENPALAPRSGRSATSRPTRIRFTSIRRSSASSIAPRSIRRTRAAAGAGASAEAWETGAKDTVVAYPGEITRLAAKFDLKGQYVWHCHILDHEDHDMMRPMVIGKPQDPNA
jgi:hypothetical protein